MHVPKLIAWDFDGVLNDNAPGGQLVWHSTFEADLGLPLAAFQDYVFRSGRFRDVLVGRRDLTELLKAFLARHDTEVTAEALMAYWFAKDAHPSAEMKALLSATSARSIIATNNEPYRAAYIGDDMGFGSLVETLIASGTLGAAKPDAAFWNAVEALSGLSGADILLVDDAEANTVAAAAQGWQVFHVSGTVAEAADALATRFRAMSLLQ